MMMLFGMGFFCECASPVFESKNGTSKGSREKEEMKEEKNTTEMH